GAAQPHSPRDRAVRPAVPDAWNARFSHLRCGRQAIRRCTREGGTTCRIRAGRRRRPRVLRLETQRQYQGDVREVWRLLCRRHEELLPDDAVLTVRGRTGRTEGGELFEHASCIV